MTDHTTEVGAELAEVILRRLDQLAERSQQPRRFMTIKTAAEYADLSEDTIRRLLERGDLTAHRPVAGRVLVDREALDRLILGSTRRPRAGRGIRRETRG
jgi:excisionase family DNA binding protein